MRYHGNYCGPNWSAGQHQQSVVSPILPTDAFDLSCLEHDTAYAIGSDRAQADLKFAKTNLTLTNPKRLAAAIAVGTQGLLRHAVPMPARRLRGSLPHDPLTPIRNSRGPLTNAAIDKRLASNKRMLVPVYPSSINHPSQVNSCFQESYRKQPEKPSTASAVVETRTAGVALGTTLRGTRPRVDVSKDSVRVRSQDLLAAVDGPSSASIPELGLQWAINPCYLASGSLSMYTPFYDEYRVNSLTITFHTKMPTSANGEIFMAITDNPTSNLYDISSTNFVAKFMTTPNAIMGPIWETHTMTWQPSDPSYKKVNPLTDASPVDSTYGDFMLYVQSTTTGGSVGYALLHYDVTFRKKRFTSAATMLAELSPTISTSCNEVGTLGAHVVNDPVQLVINAVSFASAGATRYGAVFEAIYDSATAFPSVWASRILGGTTTNLSILPGQKFYLTIYSASGGNYTARVYSNYSSAISAGADWLVWNDTSAVSTSLAFQITQVFASVVRTIGAV